MFRFPKAVIREIIAMVRPFFGGSKKRSAISIETKATILIANDAI